MLRREHGTTGAGPTVLCGNSTQQLVQQPRLSRDLSIVCCASPLATGDRETGWGQAPCMELRGEIWKERGNKPLDALVYNATARPEEVGIFFLFTGISHLLALKSASQRLQFSGAGHTRDRCPVPSRCWPTAQPGAARRRPRVRAGAQHSLPCTALVKLGN